MDLRIGVMELLICPNCGGSVQAADALLGRRVRCFACQHAFVATPSAVPPRPPTPRPPQEDRDTPEDSDEQGPFCPGCGRRIRWRDARCPHCGEELELEDAARRGRRADVASLRRDYEPHRAALILSLGNVSMIVGALSLCSFGAGAMISVPLGILAWLMANRDLNEMSEGRMDPRGKRRTETGRIAAIVGIVLGMIFGAFYALLFLAG